MMLFNAIIAILAAVGAHYIQIDTDITLHRVKPDSNLVWIDNMPCMFGKWLEGYMAQALESFGYIAHDCAWNAGNDAEITIDGITRYVELKTWMFSLYDVAQSDKETAIETYFQHSTAGTYIYATLDKMGKVTLYVMTPELFKRLVIEKGLFKPSEGKIRWRMTDNKFPALIKSLSD